MERGTRGEAAVRVDAAPEALYDLVTDVTRMGEWSPENVGGRWLDGAVGPGVGARFRGRNRRGVMRWTNTCRVTEAERGRVFTFVAPDVLGRPNTRWSYRFEPSGTGTEVTESFEMLRAMPGYVELFERIVIGVPDRRADLQRNLRTSLDRIKVTAEDR